MGFLAVILLYTHLGALADSANFTDLELFSGMTSEFTCLLVQERSVQRIKLSDHIDPIHRNLALINERGATTAVAKARCAYNESSYTCEWGKRNKLVISMANVYESATNRMQPAPVLKGHIKTGVFRPKAEVSCPLSVSAKM